MSDKNIILIPCLYSFEGSQAAYEVMSIPLGIMKAGNLILGREKFSETLKPLEERAENTGIPAEILLNVTALLRVLDGCDVQSDSVINEEF